MLLIICLFTGHIYDFLIFICIIFVHELGHIVGGILFSWDIDRVIILPFGGLTVFNIFINTSLFQQFIVTLLGPIFQIVFYLIISHFFVISKNVCFYNYVLLIFNLLPIYPLDGSKFMYVLFCLFFPFKYSHLLLLWVSLIFIFCFLFFVGYFDLFVVLILLFLFFKVVSEFRNHRFIFNKFLFERYIYDFNFRFVRRVNSINGMYLWCRHLFDDGDMCVTEREKLLKMFDKRYKLW